MAVLIALAAAAAYGISDFVGGLAARRTSAWPVAAVSATASMTAALALATLVPGAPDRGDLAWGALAGLGSGAGAAFLYRGLAAGRMGVVGPVSAVGAAALPVVVGLVGGERPSVLVWLGILVAGPAIWLVAREPAPASGTNAGPAAGRAAGRAAGLAAGLADGILAGAGFGMLFAALGQVDEGAGLWPVAIAQGVGVPTIVALALLLGADWVPRQRAAVRGGLASGLLSAAAVVGFLVATQRGLLAVSAVLTSLYPAVTVLLAALLLRERIHGVQAVGLALCGVCVTLVALG